MNDRIKELLEQSTEHIMGVPVVNQKRFAELIVFECIKLAVFKGDSTTGKVIKDHFGIINE
jgi:hypothetical protein